MEEARPRGMGGVCPHGLAGRTLAHQLGVGLEQGRQKFGGPTRGSLTRRRG